MIQIQYRVKRIADSLFKTIKTKIRTNTKSLLRILCQSPRILPYNPEKFGPIGYYEHTKIWTDNVINKMNVSYREIHSAGQLIRSKPNTVEDEIHWKFTENYKFPTPGTFVVNIPNGRVYGERGIIITHDDHLLVDVSPGFVGSGETPLRNPVFKKIRLPDITYTNDMIAVLACCGGDTFYHWMFDLLPRLELLNRSGINVDRYYINYKGFPYQKETLEMLGFDENKFIPSSNKLHLQAENLVVPSYPGISGNMPRWACDFLRNTFLKEYIHIHKNRIYISRNKAAGRQITNEYDLLQILSKYGFKTVYLEELSFQEQISTFASAEMIIAPHGAGLSNLVFCDPGTKVIEIFSPNYVIVCYFALSKQTDLNYYYVIGEGKRPPKYIDPSLGRENITVNIQQIQQILQQF